MMRNIDRAKGAALLSALTVTATLANVVLATSPAAAGPLPTPVNACGVLGAPGHYILSANLGPFAGSCLVVTAPNITLNLNGHTLMGMGTGGGVKLLPSATNAVVFTSQPNALVTQFHAGIQDYANDALIEGHNLNLVNNVGAGVYLDNVAASAVRGVDLAFNGNFGVNVENSKAVVLRGNTVRSNHDYGIWAQSTTASKFVGNTVFDNKVAGIYLGCSSTANLQEIGCPPSEGSLIKGNVLHNNGPFGIAIADESLANQIDDNTALGDSSAGLWDENPGCSGPLAPPNSWQQNTGSRNQTGSPTCIG
jgi:parallel beta-helix repeat protein